LLALATVAALMLTVAVPARAQTTGGGVAQRDTTRVDTLAADTVPVDTVPAPTPARRGGIWLILDRLRIRAFGVQVGRVGPARMAPTDVYAIEGDYGHITPKMQLVFEAQYWESRYNLREVRTLVDSVQSALGGQPGDNPGRIGRIAVSDFAMGPGLRWSPFGRSQFLRPWVGASMAFHLVNVEGAPLSGTFVEATLDNISTGLGAQAGLDITPLSHVTIGMQARYDFLSGMRFGSVRVGARYIFNPHERETALTSPRTR
jgi:hypothetical protein